MQQKRKTYISRNKMITFLGLAILIIGFTAYMEYRALEKIHNNIMSIYADRLIPATEMFYISDNLFGNRLELEDRVTEPAEATAPTSISRRNAAVDSLISEFEKTYIVTDESEQLQNFKRHYRQYQELESEIAERSSEGDLQAARELFNGQSKIRFNEMIGSLHQLTRIQSSVGRQLLKDSDVDYASTSMLSYLRLAGVMVIALLVISLIRQPGPKEQHRVDPRLN